MFLSSGADRSCRWITLPDPGPRISLPWVCLGHGSRLRRGQICWPLIPCSGIRHHGSRPWILDANIWHPWTRLDEVSLIRNRRLSLMASPSGNNGLQIHHMRPSHGVRHAVRRLFKHQGALSRRCHFQGRLTCVGTWSLCIQWTTDAQRIECGPRLQQLQI